MRLLSIAVLVVLSCAIADGGGAKNAPSAKELIAKFRKAIGADAVKSTPYVIKYRGQRYLYSLADGRLQGQAYAFDASLTSHTSAPQTRRAEMEMKIGIVPFKIVEVVDGDTGWYQINEGDPAAMPKSIVKGRRERDMHIDSFLGLEAFSPDRWQFTEPKGATVRGQEAWQFNGTLEGLEPMTISFAKDTGLLLQITTKATDYEFLPGAAPKIESFTRDMHFYDWKKFTTRMLPGHFDVFQNGVLWKQMEPVEVLLPETLDAKVFVMPKAKM